VQRVPANSIQTSLNISQEEGTSEDIQLVGIYEHCVYVWKTIVHMVYSTDVSRRPDVVYRYFCDTDTLSIYFVKAVPGLIHVGDDVYDSVLVDYTVSRKIVSVDISGASSWIPCHFFDVPLDVDGGFIDNKPPFQLHQMLDPVKDQLIVYFVKDPALASDIATLDDKVLLGQSDDGGLIYIKVMNPFEAVAVPQNL
jgi:uncharacterized protein YuzE